MATFADKSLEELLNLTITKVYWRSFNGILGFECLGFSLNDGQSCRAGERDYTKSYTFKQAKKITRISTVIWNMSMTSSIIQINFYHHQERLLRLGDSDKNALTEGNRKKFLILTTTRN